MSPRWSRSDALTAAVGRLIGGLPGLAPTFLVVALLACVLVPLPPVLVDLLLSLSIAGAVLLLVAGIAVGRAAEFLEFPSLLLLVTLYRLALNVSTTRLILSQAYAGEVIEAFASFVIRGDLLVGGVMFVIITIVQYVVIAKGAERVAEVAARFALDGLPGHQAAIDADLKAGVITPGEASAKRAALAERSSFYGAMDGAVRFVKGDAVAGLAIIIVNLTGGIAVGMIRFDYGWERSLAVFGRLTIGDGLLAQIPALLVSLAAGVLVARVDRHTEARAQSGVRWLRPAMLVVPATLLTALALVPAMPALAFLASAAALITIALALSARDALAERMRPHPRVGQGLTVRIAAGDLEVADLERALSEVRRRCQQALAIEVPALVLRRSDADDPPGRLEIFLDDRLCRRQEGVFTEDAVVLTTFRVVMDTAPEFIDFQAVDRQLDQLRATEPLLVRRALEVATLDDIVAVIRGFLRERISVPPLRAVLAVVIDEFDETLRPGLPERVRGALAPHWVPGLIDGLLHLGPPRWWRLTPDAEDALGEAGQALRGGREFDVVRSVRERWLAHIRRVASANGDDGPLVLVATPRCRRHAAALVSVAVPFIPVLSTSELELGQAICGVDTDVHWLDPPEEP